MLPHVRSVCVCKGAHWTHNYAGSHVAYHIVLILAPGDTSLGLDVQPFVESAVFSVHLVLY
jgi:hypothetical protein